MGRAGGMKRQNPRSVPKTQADVDRAFSMGSDFGLEFGLNLVLYVLKDKHQAPDEDILQLRDEFMYVVDSIAKKYLTYGDIKAALKSDYDLAVRLLER